jgi:hypothetical protein
MLLVSCEAEEIPVAFDEKIIVEGFIEEGKGAVVWLSRSLGVPYGNVDYGVETTGSIPIRLAKVSVVHEGREEVLVSRADPDHLLGWCYRGDEIVGEQGGEYTLTVDYSGYTLTATTTIPAPGHLSEITLEKETGGESYIMNVSIEDIRDEGYYMLMAKYRDEGVYNPCPFGIVAGCSPETEKFSITAFRPMDIDLKGGYVPMWHSGEHVLLRLASIDPAAFEYWSDFMSDVINAHNPIYPSSANLSSNIEGGGLGIWYGFSASYGNVDIEDMDKINKKETGSKSSEPVSFCNK